MATIAEALTAAREHHRAGNLARAEQLYRLVLRADPGNAEALHLLGVLAHQAGQPGRAVDLLREALARDPARAAAHADLGLVHQMQGRRDEAVACYRQALRLGPDVAAVHNNLGAVLRELGRRDEAAAECREALRLWPDYPEAHVNLGTALVEQGRDGEAEACYRAALRLRPGYAAAHNALGVALRRQGRLDEAAASLCQALHHRPDFPDALLNLGITLAQQNQADGAADCFLHVVRRKPDSAEAHLQLGLLRKTQRRPEEAAAHLRQALALRPDSPEILLYLGETLREQGRFAEAADVLRRALALRPEFAEAHNCLGIALRELDRADEARVCFEEALRLRPDYVEAVNNLAGVFQDLGQLDQTLECYARALNLKPDYPEIHFNRAVVRLLRGDLAQGWPEYEWRWRCTGFPARDFPQPVWDGGPLKGKTILLHAEQGLGDTIQFVRYAPLVKERGGTVVLECQPALLALLRDVAGVDRLVGRGEPLPAFDVQAGLMSLPGILGTTFATVPAAVPYLAADPGRVERWRHRLEAVPGFRVGIAWQGNPVVRADARRSIALEHFAPLAGVEGVGLVSLQKGPGVEQLRALAGRFPVLDLGDELDEAGAFLDTAAVMKNLDLVVSSDTAIPHLAGALAVPVWVALAALPDWRWFLGREDSPWYPTMRLYRQQRPGDWAEVFARLADALRRSAAQPGGAGRSSTSRQNAGRPR